MSQINSYIKDDFQDVLLLSCFVGHPVCTLGNYVLFKKSIIIPLMSNFGLPRVEICSRNSRNRRQFLPRVVVKSRVNTLLSLL